ncbi:MAG TPA: ABC transporter substrate-binding protein [Actinomycetota bacterium]
MPKTTNGKSWAGTISVFAVGALIGAISAVQLVPQGSGSAAGVPADDPGIETYDGQETVADELVQSQPNARSRTEGPIQQGGASLACAPGQNGGATDTGVTADTIKLATTTVQSGIGAAFLGDVKYAMEAVKNKVNREGGICGRLLDVTYVDDGWDAARGATYLQNFMKGDYFAIAVGPSSEGLRVVIDNGDIGRAGMPVVGTDGMIINQYTDPWVWPVSVATASSARIMARNAHERGAREFSIVFDKDYRFGAEAAEAYNNEVRRLTGSNVKGFNKDHNCVQSFCGILAGQSGYATQVNQFERADFVAMFLEPQTALTWMSTPGAPQPRTTDYGIGGAQPLFTRDFANSCQAACNGMWIWTGYRPPIESYANEPAVRTFVNDLKSTKRDADEFNAFAMGGYVGMHLLVEALKRTGPLLTRERLQATLDSMSLQPDLTIQKQLTWSASNHFANYTMRAFSIQYKGTLGGWRAQDTEKDPTPQRGIS